MSHAHDDASSPLIPFLWGLAVGAAAALLFAPTSGEELRSNLRSRAGRLKDLAVEKAGEFEEDLEETYEHARAKVEEELDSARRLAGDTRRAARDVVNAGKEAATTAREELERRLADAREVRRAGRAAAPPADEE